jgi:hypothetical protein
MLQQQQGFQQQQPPHCLEQQSQQASSLNLGQLDPQLMELLLPKLLSQPLTQLQSPTIPTSQHIAPSEPFLIRPEPLQTCSMDFMVK